jgi:glycerol-3-phosphate dehydrogenase
VFAYPWAGVTLVGTTDLDHHADLRTEPSISADEVRYLLAALDAQFPAAHITRNDIVSTFAGVRPVIGTGTNPSNESRDDVLIEDRGVVTITGGKLTTFRPMALRALKAACKRAGARIDIRAQRILDDAPATTFTRLNGRYGVDARNVVDFAKAGELEAIAGTQTTWAELRYALRGECVVHLDDLLLRRTRLGLQLRDGAKALFPRAQALCAEELGWDDAKWEREARMYRERIRTHYGVPA